MKLPVNAPDENYEDNDNYLTILGGLVELDKLKMANWLTFEIDDQRAVLVQCHFYDSVSRDLGSQAPSRFFSASEKS